MARNVKGYIANAHHDRDWLVYHEIGIHGRVALTVDFGTMTADLTWKELRFHLSPWSPFKQNVLAPALREAIMNMRFRDMPIDESGFRGSATLSVDAQRSSGEPVYKAGKVELAGAFYRRGGRDSQDPHVAVALNNPKSGNFGLTFGMEFVAYPDDARASRGSAIHDLPDDDIRCSVEAMWESLGAPELIE